MEQQPPSEPRAEERFCYHYGLPSHPILAARSNSDPWGHKIVDDWSVGKGFRPVGRHPIVELWNDSTGPLRCAILEAFESVRWVAIDILRIRYDIHDGSSEEFDQPVTLFISVVPNSIPWSQGYPIVMRCRDILQQHGMYDIYCKMKESRVGWSAAYSPAAAP